jgi:superoxide dismutase
MIKVVKSVFATMMQPKTHLKAKFADQIKSDYGSIGES